MAQQLTSTDAARTGARSATPSPPAASTTGLQNLSAVLLLLACLSSAWTGVRFGSVTLVDMFTALSFAALVAAPARTRTTTPALWVPAAGFLVVMLLTSLVAGIWPDARREAAMITGVPAATILFQVRNVIRFALATAVLTTLVYSHLMRTSWVTSRLVITTFAASSITSAGVAAAGIQIGFVSTDVAAVTTRSIGLAFHPNSLATSVAIMAPVLVHWCFHGHPLARLVLGVGGLGLSAVGLLAADSRTGLITFAALVALSFAVETRHTRAYAWAVPSVLALAVAAWVFLPGLLAETRLGGGAGSVTGSDLLRAFYRQRAFDGFLESPVIGLGAQHFGTAVMIPLDILVSGGIFAFVLYAAYLGTAALAAVRAEQRGVFPNELLLVALLGVVLIGLGQNSETERFLYWVVPVALAYRRADLERDAQVR